MAAGGGFRKISKSVDPGSIAATTRVGTAVTITGVDTDDIVYAVPPAALNDDLLFVGCRVTAKNTVTVYLYNPTGGAIDDTARTWDFLVFRGETAPISIS